MELLWGKIIGGKLLSENYCGKKLLGKIIVGTFLKTLWFSLHSQTGGVKDLNLSQNVIHRKTQSTAHEQNTVKTFTEEES